MRAAASEGVAASMAVPGCVGEPWWSAAGCAELVGQVVNGTKLTPDGSARRSPPGSWRPASGLSRSCDGWMTTELRRALGAAADRDGGVRRSTRGGSGDGASHRVSAGPVPVPVPVPVWLVGRGLGRTCRQVGSRRRSPLILCHPRQDCPEAGTFGLAIYGSAGQRSGRLGGVRRAGRSVRPACPACRTARGQLCVRPAWRRANQESACGQPARVRHARQPRDDRATRPACAMCESAGHRGGWDRGRWPWVVEGW